MVVLDTLKYLLSILKGEAKKVCTDYVEYTLYSKPYDFSEVVPYTGGQQIRVIGRIVTRY